MPTRDPILAVCSIMQVQVTRSEMPRDTAYDCEFVLAVDVSSKIINNIVGPVAGETPGACM